MGGEDQKRERGGIITAVYHYVGIVSVVESNSGRTSNHVNVDLIRTYCFAKLLDLLPRQAMYILHIYSYLSFSCLDINVVPDPTEPSPSSLEPLLLC